MQSGLVAAEPAAYGGSTTAQESPLQAFFRASSWSRADYELLLNTVQVVLLAMVIYAELRS